MGYESTSEGTTATLPPAAVRQLIGVATGFAEKMKRVEVVYDEEPETYVMIALRALRELRESTVVAQREIAEYVVLGAATGKPTLRQMADALGVAHTTVRKWVADPVDKEEYGSGLVDLSDSGGVAGRS